MPSGYSDIKKRLTLSCNNFMKMFFFFIQIRADGMSRHHNGFATAWMTVAEWAAGRQISSSASLKHLYLRFKRDPRFILNRFSINLLLLLFSKDLPSETSSPTSKFATIFSTLRFFVPWSISVPLLLHPIYLVRRSLPGLSWLLNEIP